MSSTTTLLLSALGIYSIAITIMFIQASKCAERKERMIRRLHDKVIQYRLAVCDINSVCRVEKEDDKLL